MAAENALVGVSYVVIRDKLYGFVAFKSTNPPGPSLTNSKLFS
jgi:hypothetical protein